MKTNVLKFLLCCFVFGCLNNKLRTQDTQTDTTFKVENYFDESDHNEGGYVNFFNLGLGAFVPRNAMNQKLDKSLFSFNLSYFRQLFKYKPFFAGFEFAYARIDGETAEIEYIYDDGFKELIDDRVTSDVKQFNFIGRYYLPMQVWVIDPFVEFGYNLQWYSTSSTLLFDGEDNSEIDYIKNDLVGQYGISAGLNFQIFENSYGLFRMGYYSGLSAFYYTQKDNINFAPNRTIDYFDLQKSATDMIKWDIGFTFAF